MKKLRAYKEVCYQIISLSNPISFYTFSKLIIVMKNLYRSREEEIEIETFDLEKMSLKEVLFDSYENKSDFGKVKSAYCNPNCGGSCGSSCCPCSSCG